jgi:hypothetical protein
MASVLASGSGKLQLLFFLDPHRPVTAVMGLFDLHLEKSHASVFNPIRAA